MGRPRRETGLVAAVQYSAAMAESQTEIELKLQVPEAALAAVTRAVHGTGKARRTRLQAVYFETADRRLAAAGIAVRIRLEGTQWVQTAKAGDPHAMTRHEHNAPLPAPPKGQVPQLDLTRHAGTRAGELVEAALAATGGRPAATLAPLYRTDIERTHRTVRVPGGRVELALDIGRILAADREWPVCELEIELVSGHPDAVIGAARRWVERHGLWLDVRSKAERGDRLSRVDEPVRVIRATAPQGEAGAKAREAWRSVLVAGLAHVLPNASEVASGTFSAGHLHQLRTGLRHLCTAMRLFDGLTSGPEQGVLTALNDARRALGAARDLDAIAAVWQAPLHAAGAPVALPAPVGAAGTAAHIARRPALMDALLALQSWCLADGTLGPQPPDFAQALAARLHRWHRRVIRSAAQYAKLDETERHRLRRRIKRLRDALTLVRFLFRKKPLKQPLQQLNDAQAALGRVHDLAVAIAACEQAAADDARHWFSVGWLAAQQDAAERSARKAVARLARARALPAGAALKAR